MKKHSEMKRIAGAFALVLAGFSGAAFAEGSPAFDTDINFVLATTLETKLSVSESVTVPFLVGEGPLFSGNNVKLTGTAEFSPVSLNGAFGVAWTPVAVLQLYGRATVGTGWNIPGLATGLAMNVPSDTGDKKGVKVNKDFGGAVWGAKGGATVQFDFAAIFPGEWNHVVIQSSHEARYRAFTGACSKDSWYYEADDGENRNGLQYYGNAFLGYQMPIVLNLAGILVEDEVSLYGTDGGDKWGDALPRLTFGTILNFKFSDHLTSALIIQGRTRRTWTNGTGDNFYQYRTVDSANPLHPEFYRVAVNATYRL
jgi:hypothetical protein